MSTVYQQSEPFDITPAEIDYDALLEPVHFSFALQRREFVQLLGAGLVVSVAIGPALGQRRGGRPGGGFQGGPPAALSTRIHIAENGQITVLSGKVEAGQGARTQIAMAAAEELRVPLESIDVLLADTGKTPDDGMTAGSRTTPSTIPSVRQAAAAVRKLLDDYRAAKPEATYADLVRDPELKAKLAARAPENVELMPDSQDDARRHCCERWRICRCRRPHVVRCPSGDRRHRQNRSMG
jgi:CO/xanthine dehydrogenase Mo-binding subunit